ncbi:MAG: efflux system outer rane lipoprotein NodT family [Rickettsiales bacterium]|jgi:multidrug efflux system outer membrane protein|nr:efflux system outer rane lipoprotein NodT family [Rickettsiales bacterium]
MNYTRILSITTALVLTGCSLAPSFHKPEMAIPESFKEKSVDVELEPDAGSVIWKNAEPRETSNRGEWWKIFGDEQLNTLEAEAITANQSLKAIGARVEQSRAIANVARGGFFPSLDVGGNATRTKLPGDGVKPYNTFNAGGVASYEVDLFGRVRDGYRASRFDAKAQNSLYNSALLALQADVAQHYFSLRALDSERDLLRATVKIRAEAARIMEKRLKEGASGEQDRARTQSELAIVEADLIALERQRAKSEHALAVLLGKLPSEFTFADTPLEDIVPPPVPSGLPSELLERRPDISASLHSVEATNSRIGVARAAFFPSITLGASGGFQSGTLSDLFNSSSETWIAGQVAQNAVSLPIFHGGRLFAGLKGAKAANEEAVANYRQQVLTAFREVEDNLIDQRLLAEQSLKQEKAASTASRTTYLAKKRYQEGETDYFEVVDSERVSLAAERGAVQIRGQRFFTTIALIRALGGGWDDETHEDPS